MADLRVTELDFEQIKRNLINYLSSQEEFADYNFSGSGLNTIIDLLRNGPAQFLNFLARIDYETPLPLPKPTTSAD